MVEPERTTTVVLAMKLNGVRKLVAKVAKVCWASLSSSTSPELVVRAGGVEAVGLGRQVERQPRDIRVDEPAAEEQHRRRGRWPCKAHGDHLIIAVSAGGASTAPRRRSRDPCAAPPPRRSPARKAR